jgi:regulator of protease activity HflC (stomatin/prohibitin superfamily)
VVASATQAPGARAGRVLFTSLALLCGVGSLIVIVPAGHVGVPVLFGQVQDTAMPEGLHLMNPLARVEQFSIRTETYTMNTTGDDAVNVLTSDGVLMPIDVSVAYRLVPGDAPAMYRHVGRNYVETIIRPAARAAIPEAVAKYSFQDAYASRREELVARMQQTVTARMQSILTQYAGLRGGGVQVQEVFLRRIQMPENLKQAIEQKMQAEQDAQRMDFVLQREEREAERKRIEARGIRDFQAIVTEGISEKLLQWKGIEATETLSKSPNAKVVIVGAGKGGLPLILNPGP